MSSAIPLSEADLHGVVDGHLEAGRRSEVLRRLAAAPADRARIDAWQEQNDLIKSAFFGIEKEPLPASLRLTPPPSLHCVPLSEALIEGPRVPQPASPRKRTLAGIASVLLIVGGLGGSWMLVQSADDDPQLVDLRLRGTVDETLASQAAGAVARDAAIREAAGTGSSDSLPVTTIPDLTEAGFVFTSADALPAQPRSLVFHYRDAAADRVVVSVARAPRSADTRPTRVGHGFSWHRGNNAFAIAGTVRPERLRAMASLLHGTGPGD